jgi:hypothetical protein
MKVTLTKIKYAAFASQETPCFEAVVMLDGKASIHVSNDGHGGGNYERDIIPGSSKRLAEYAKTLPPIEFKHGSEVTLLAMNSELLVGELLDEHLNRKNMIRALNRAVHFKSPTKPGILVLRKTKWELNTMTMVREYLKKNHPGAVILNELKEDEAFKLWKEAA